MKILAIIPARSGSKGVPDKNILPIRNVPLLSFSVWSALKAGVFDEILVSTDEPSYFETIKMFNLQNDYIRPKHLATDTSPTIDAVVDALKYYKSIGKTFDSVMLLQPTSPFRPIQYIQHALNLLKVNPEASCVTSVVRVWDHHPARIKKIENNMWLVNFCEDFPEIEPSRRQDLQPPAYIRNGSIFLTPIDTIMHKRLIWGDKVLPFEMPEANSINIDSHIDFIKAQAMLDYSPYRKHLAEFDELIAIFNK